MITLGTLGETKCPCRAQDPLSHLGFQTKASHRHTSSVQAQGQDQRSWGATNLWSQLLGDFLPSGQLVLYQAYSGPIIGLPMENEAD